ncbi:MAG: cytochrome c maturation protein CcmE [Myxococcales bacterium]|nr:cytochrome c maturation protein CcmE [Myxococcales bacterium]
MTSPDADPKSLDPVEPIDRPVEGDGGDYGGGLSPLVKVGVVFAMLGGAIALLWFTTTAEDAFVYSKLVEEVLEQPADFAGRELRVEGDLKQGSIQFKEQPCEWRFVLSGKGHEMPVSFPQCIVPDTFKDGMGLKVTVQGKLTPEGHFHANQVIPRCPSKYEMQQREAAGEKMPHAAPMGSAI